METPDLRQPWLVAAWPGLGAVGRLAADHLARALHARPMGDLALDRWYDAPAIAVEHGLVTRAKRPRTTLHGWSNAEPAGHDLLIALGEAQPAQDAWGLAHALLDQVRAHGVSRVVTFAALATPVEPGEPARVFAVATSPAVLDEAVKAGAQPLEDGQVGGLNGVLMGAGVTVGLEGLCLLGEFPHVASALPSPKAAAAVLEVFRSLAGVPLDLEALRRQGELMDKQLLDALAEVKAQAAAEGAPEGATEEPARPAAPPPGPTAPGPKERARIEALFDQAAADRSRTAALKAELDRLGLFQEYEDRFLDLFKRAE